MRDRLRETADYAFIVVGGGLSGICADLARRASVQSGETAPGFAPENVINGVARTTETENAWQSLPLAGGSAALELHFASPVRVGQVRVTFDSDLSAEIMISMTKTVQDRQVRGLPAVLVRDFTLRLWRGGTCVREEEIRENVQRLRVLSLPEAVEADRIEIEVRRTWGSDAARIYEVRVYEDPELR